MLFRVLESSQARRSDALYVSNGMAGPEVVTVPLAIYRILKSIRRQESV